MFHSVSLFSQALLARGSRALPSVLFHKGVHSCLIVFKALIKQTHLLNTLKGLNHWETDDLFIFNESVTGNNAESVTDQRLGLFEVQHTAEGSSSRQRRREFKRSLGSTFPYKMMLCLPEESNHIP